MDFFAKANQSDTDTKPAFSVGVIKVGQVSSVIKQVFFELQKKKKKKKEKEKEQKIILLDSNFSILLAFGKVGDVGRSYEYLIKETFKGKLTFQEDDR